ncbi:MAG: hypothetical protein M3R13_05870 [Armatimonadota bacterium]|nr:hypothetical protein [Armatimonadota bacterium]
MFSIGVLSLAALASAQHLGSVYNRDTGEAFELKSATTTSTVYGAIVKNKTVFTFANPYKSLTEASVNFSLGQGSVLDGFAYWYKNEYVKGVLMDKAKAWFIYTAITSRHRDPGIMEQVTPDSFHAQIYPLAVGYDLRVELTAVEFLQPTPDGWRLPEIPTYNNIRTQRFVNTANPYIQMAFDEGHYEVHKPRVGNVQVFTTAQRGPGGRIYVAGVVHSADDNVLDVDLSLRDAHIVAKKAGEASFVGWTRSTRPFSVNVKDSGRVSVPVSIVTEGDEASKLWAHQMLINHEWKTRKEVMDFSMRYQVPSKFTALLAVPEEEMKLFREKASEFEKKKKEEARRARNWENDRNLNWKSSQGGDPEIRIAFDNCISAHAKLPDGRVINLKQTSNGVWGGNFEIPAEAAEGEYIVKVFAIKRSGEVVEKELKYDVDRTAPQGKLEINTVRGIRVVKVTTEAGLERVVAYLADGEESRLKEVEPGIYTATLPKNARGELLIVMFDAAHNRGELKCFLR